MKSKAGTKLLSQRMEGIFCGTSGGATVATALEAGQPGLCNAQDAKKCEEAFLDLSGRSQSVRS